LIKPARMSSRSSVSSIGLVRKDRTSAINQTMPESEINVSASATQRLHSKAMRRWTTQSSTSDTATSAQIRGDRLR
jgi:hypothetical protein